MKTVLPALPRKYRPHIQGPGQMSHKVSVRDAGALFSRDRFDSSEEAVAAAEAEMTRLGLSRPMFEIVVHSWPEGPVEVVLSENPRIVEHRSYREYGGIADPSGGRYSVEAVTCDTAGVSIRIDDDEGMVVTIDDLSISANDAGWDERHLEVEIKTAEFSKDYEF